jgi:hypothetical protein
MTARQYRVAALFAAAIASVTARGERMSEAQ